MPNNSEMANALLNRGSSLGGEPTSQVIDKRYRGASPNLPESTNIDDRRGESQFSQSNLNAIFGQAFNPAHLTWEQLKKVLANPMTPLHKLFPPVLPPITGQLQIDAGALDIPSR